jgi:hypothetical protein
MTVNNRDVKDSSEKLITSALHPLHPLLGYLRFNVRVMVPRSTLLSLEMRRDAKPLSRLGQVT